MITQSQLKTELHYDPETGVFIRLIARCNRVKVGDVAGTPDSAGYRQIRVLGRLYLASRLAWLYMVGEWPEGFEVEHRDLDPGNDRWSNLRIATRSQNRQNTRSYSNNKLGVKNIFLVDGRYRLKMTIEGKRQHIGYYKNINDAIAKQTKLAIKHHGEFARVS